MSDFEVHRVDPLAGETKLRLDFGSQNPIELERFVARAIAGLLQFQE
jgi:hypothetical protein